MEESGDIDRSNSDWIRLNVRASEAFTPAAPIDAKELFAGRTEQLDTLIDAICQRGQHAIIYGERGVGKTSLATIQAQFLEDIGKRVVAPRINCDSSDNFSTLWKKVFAEVQVSKRIKKIGYQAAEEVEVEVSDISETLQEVISPNDVRVRLTELCQGAILVVILDEFDRIEDERVKVQFSDTIKALSDYSVPATIVLVGVADSVTDLIAHHESIERSLVQIPLPRMKPAEMEQILSKAMEKLAMQMELNASLRIAGIARGLPHYVHLVGLNATREAIAARRLNVTAEDVEKGIEKSIANAQQSIRQMYYDATISRKKGSIYSRLLLACALAKADEFGYFTAADIREPMSLIMKKNYTIPYYAKQLHELCKKSRGAVLQKPEDKARPRFRFRNPLLQPHVIMQGFKDGMRPLPLAG